MSCQCHGATFCPDLICIGYEDDVPVFVRKDSEVGAHALAYQAAQTERRERAELTRLKAKYEPLVAEKQTPEERS